MNNHSQDNQVDHVYTEATLLSPEQTLFAARNAAMMVQEQTRRFHERSITGRGLHHCVRRFVINQFVRPFVLPLLEQQQDYNAAVLRSMYTFAEITDRFHVRLNDVHGEVEHIYARLDEINQTLQGLSEHLKDVRGNVEKTHVYMGDFRQGLHQMNEQVLHQRHLVSQCMDEIAEQLASLEEAIDQIQRWPGSFEVAQSSPIDADKQR
jgi:predicted DNA-binding protein YlxM (UPF0122 family)